MIHYITCTVLERYTTLHALYCTNPGLKDSHTCTFRSCPQGYKVSTCANRNLRFEDATYGPKVHKRSSK